MNGFIASHADTTYKNDKWDMHSTDQNNKCCETDSISNPSIPFNPLICKPSERG